MESVEAQKRRINEEVFQALNFLDSALETETSVPENERLHQIQTLLQASQEYKRLIDVIEIDLHEIPSGICEILKLLNNRAVSLKAVITHTGASIAESDPLSRAMEELTLRFTGCLRNYI